MSKNGRVREVVEGVVAFYDPDLGAHSCLLCWLPPSASAETCDEVSPGVESRICTREPGHTGPHAACGSNKGGHPLIIWETQDAAP